MINVDRLHWADGSIRRHPVSVRRTARPRGRRSYARASRNSILEAARAAEFFLADGVIVSGIATGQPADVEDVKAVARAVAVPTCVGSGITLDNLHDYSDADALIVGSSVKHGGVWSGAIDEALTGALARAFNKT
jgi:predicted TIM-barrel enzyme